MTYDNQKHFMCSPPEVLKFKRRASGDWPRIFRDSPARRVEVADHEPSPGHFGPAAKLQSII